MIKKNKIIIKNASNKDLKKINSFHNHYYRSNRSIKQFLWLFRQSAKSKKFKDYYFASKGKKIFAILGFIKFNFVLKKKKYLVIKPEDLLLNIDSIKANVFEKINKKFEKNIKNSNTISILFNAVGWAFKRINYIPYFGKRVIYIKYHRVNSLALFLTTKKVPKLLTYFFSFLIIYSLKIFTFCRRLLVKKKVTFKNFKKPPIWSNNINKSFINYWKFLTVDRDQRFLKWRVFNNPFMKAQFTAFYYNKIPIGYLIYNKNMNNLYIVDLIIVPPNSTFKIESMLDEILFYLDDYCIVNGINYCKFEIYLNNKLNNLLEKSLLNLGYFKKRVDTNFSFKIFNKSINKKTISESYLTNINKSGKWH
tara:strand:+ start:1406 stop:2497 length:1092 start_codon:yes stop_codon:yes gene_type:complete